MNNILKRQYGLFTSICIVVGFVVGTGIFWRPGLILYYTGDLWLGVLAWILGGVLISTCVYMFAVMSGIYEKIHGTVDFAEKILGKNYGYLAGWFFFAMYQTAGYAIIAFISASFTATLAGHENVTNTPFVFFMTAFYMAATFALNYIAPKLPMKLNNFTTVVRIIPLIAMGTIGVLLAFIFPNEYSYAALIAYVEPREVNFLGAIFATVFAYNGWQAATAFNSEIKDSKRNFPKALLLGFFLVVVIYTLYFIGVVTAGSPEMLMENNQIGTRAAFANVFGSAASNIIMIFVIISGLGILNMCCMGMSRGLYALARRDMGPNPKRMVELDKYTEAPLNAMVVCVAVSFLWLMVIYGNHNGWFNTSSGERFSFNLPDFYNLIFFVILIPIFIGFFIKERKNKEISVFNRYIAPLLAIFGASFMIYALVSSSLIHASIYLITFVVLAIIGFLFKGK
ncbi:MAG: APC family permease [Defluviitaleaceae bacterium]|nr:APC family permease [Defluviitaleaceae bacterium]